MNNNYLLSQMWKMGSPRPRFKVTRWGLKRSPSGSCFLLRWQLLALFSYGSRARELSGASSQRTLVSFMGTEPSRPAHFQMTLPSKTIALVIGFNIGIWTEHIQTMQYPSILASLIYLHHHVHSVSH